MKILLLGKNGQVGWELQRALAPLGELVALDRAGTAELCGDLADLDGIARTIRQVQPAVIVNAAAYTLVDKAEEEPELAQRLNADAPALLAQEAARLGAWLVHYSTDYVFDGSGDRPWQEDDPTGPLSVYGATKQAGEQAILASSAKAMIFRTSWVYATRGHNFVKTMLRLAQEREALGIVADQIGAPTSADLIADVTALAISRVLGEADGSRLAGLYHLVAAGEDSWCGFARYALAEAERAGVALKVGSQQLRGISTSEYPTPARRPLNSRLCTEKLEQTFRLKMPPWQAGVHRMLQELLNKETK